MKGFSWSLRTEFIFVLIIQSLGSPIAFAQNTRLDPHGSRTQNLDLRELDRNSGCKICHSLQAGRLLTKSASAETCSNCHNQFPHSGIKEHTRNKSENITCLSCHEVHRARGKDNLESSGIFAQLMAQPLSTEVQMNQKKEAMLRKTCTDCHQWRK